MANFNQTINPTNDPNFTSITRPISIPDGINPKGVETNQIMPKGQEIGDRSAEFEGKAKAYGSEAQGMADKGFGDLFAGIVGIGDFLGKAGVQMVRKDIEDKVYEVADSERQLYTKRLEELKAGGPVKDIMAGGGEDENGNPLPSELTNLPDQLNVLASARDGGKISSTDYQARLLAAAKDLRARYPGFKNEIDQEFAKVTGHNPANAYITGLVSDINRMNSSVNSDRNKLITYIQNNQGMFNDPVEATRKVMTGEWGRLDVIKQTAPHEKLKIDLNERKAVFEDQKLTKDQKIQAGKELFDLGAEGAVTNFVSRFMTRMGLDDSTVDMMTTRTKTGELSTQRWSELGQLFANEEAQLKQAMYEDARRHGLTQTLGVDEVNKRIDAVMERTKIIKDRIYAKDVGGINRAAQLVKAMSDDDQKNAFQDSVMGPPLRATELAKRVGGEQFMQSTALQQATEGLVGKWAAYTKSMQNAIAVQADMDSTGIPLTLNRVFDEYAVKMKNATPAEKKATNISTINRILDIAKPDTPEAVKLNYAAAAFSPENRGFISRLNMDSVDARGRPIKGQNAIFQNMTSPEMTKEMYRLGQKHPQVWKNYTDWATDTLSNELISRDIRDLSQVRNPAIRVGWDSDNNRLITEFKPLSIPGAPKSGDPFAAMSRDEERRSTLTSNSKGDAEFPHVQAMINRINSNLSNYKNIADAAGASVPALLLGVISKAAGPEALQQVDNIPGDIARQIGLTALKIKSKKLGVGP
jgi:hypothetical protein